jgi:sugar/nucleoside kinase (ribokinase family)
LIICNWLEAEHLTGRKATAEQRETLRFGSRVQTVVITNGPGDIHALGDGTACSVPAYRDNQLVVDEVGAGDAAQAAIVDALLKGYPLEQALLVRTRGGSSGAAAAPRHEGRGRAQHGKETGRDSEEQTGIGRSRPRRIIRPYV